MATIATLDVLLNDAEEGLESGEDLTDPWLNDFQENLEHHAKNYGYRVNGDYLVRQNGQNVDIIIRNDGLVRYLTVPGSEEERFINFDNGSFKKTKEEHMFELIYPGLITFAAIVGGFIGSVIFLEDEIGYSVIYNAVLGAAIGSFFISLVAMKASDEQIIKYRAENYLKYAPHTHFGGEALEQAFTPLDVHKE